METLTDMNDIKQELMLFLLVLCPFLVPFFVLRHFELTTDTVLVGLFVSWMVYVILLYNLAGKKLGWKE